MEAPKKMIKTPEPESYIRPYDPLDFSDVTGILMENESYNRFDHDRTSFDRTQKDWGKDSVLVHVRSFENWRAVTGLVRITFMGPGQQKAIIGDLSVLPGEQNAGVGSKLLEAMKNVCYGRRCLPELLTNAAAPPEEIGTNLVDWYRARGFDDPYSAVGLIGDDIPRAWDYRPDAAYTVATAAVDKLHDTITSWGHELTCSVDDEEMKGGYPDFFQKYVQRYHPRLEASFDRQNLLVGHPGVNYDYDSASQGSKKVEVWGVVRTELEDVKILRHLSLPGDFYMHKAPPRVEGNYVFRFPDDSIHPSLEVVHMGQGGMRTLEHISNSSWQRIQHTESRTGYHSISAPGAILSSFYSLIKAQNTLDDMHRYDRRWCGEEGYPSFPAPLPRQHWFPGLRQMLGR